MPNRKLREKLGEESPFYLKPSPSWVLPTLTMGSGGLMTRIHVKCSVNLSPILAVNGGASAPLLIGGLTPAPPKSNANI
jgi:hypothetical protein